MVMEFIETKIKGVFIIEPVVYKDNRGYFCETFKADEFEKKVGNVHFVQENENKSSYGVLRGIHFQNPPLLKLNWLEFLMGQFLMWLWIVEKDHPPLENGCQLSCHLTIIVNYSFPMESPMLCSV